MLNFNSLNIDSQSLAVVFPGQGSQSVGMLAELSTQYPEIINIFKTASDIVEFDCWALAQSGPEAVLNQTEYTQPVLLAADVSLWRVCNIARLKPTWLAGHSLGEYAALVAAEAISFEDALRIVSARGKLMQESVPEGAGAMAAVLGLEDGVIEQVCNQVSQQLNKIISPANYNSIGQTVIAGDAQAVTQAIELLKSQGAKRAIMLPVSVPSHCALMKPAAEQLKKLLDTIEIRVPQIPVLHNSDVQSHTEPDNIRQVLYEQLYSPVRWLETIQKLSEYKIRNIIECGPGKVLTGLIKRINSEIICSNLS